MINMVNTSNLIESMLLYISQWSSPGAEKKVTVKPELNTLSFHVCARGFDLFIDTHVQASIQSQKLMSSCCIAGDEKFSSLPSTNSFHTSPALFWGQSQHWNPFLLMISWETRYMFSCECIRHTFYREFVTAPVSCLHCEAVTGTSWHEHSPGGKGTGEPTCTCPFLLFIPSSCPF